MPELIYIDRRKMHSRDSAEISIELAPYIMAYKNYKNVIELQGGSTNSVMERAYKATFDDLRIRLQECLSPFTGGDFEEVFDKAVDLQRLKEIQEVSSLPNKRIAYLESLKHSAAYEALNDSFVEILSNAVDETIAKHFESPEGTQIIDSLKASVCVGIDDQTDRRNLSITCFHKHGRGFQDSFLKRVASADERKTYMATVSSSKLADAKEMADIPLFIGGRGQGLRMLMRKIDEGTFSEADRKYARRFNKAAVSEIDFSNKVDAVGNVQGALITITTSKAAVVLVETAELTRNFKKDTQEAKKSPLSVAIDLDDSDADVEQSADDYSRASFSPSPRR